MIEIDGRSGGGQMLRTALTLSAIRQEDFRIENIRGSRPNPGLKRQHIESVKTVQRLCNAEVEGMEEGSEILVFRPEKLENKSFTVNIGTAGSITLLLDTVLPLTSQFNDSLRMTVKGGTDVKWSPALDYFKHVKLELLGQHGFKGSVERENTGYYPRGSGEVKFETGNYSLQPINITERRDIQKFEIYSRASRELEDQEVADRQADELRRKLKNSHISVPVEKNVEYEKTSSTGSSLVLKAVYENSIAGFDALGERGKRSEEVAKKVVEDFRSFHSTDAAVDEHMADQLMVFLAIVGGKIVVPEITSHIETNMSVLEKFGRGLEVLEGKEVVLRR